jgi:hypothetical protein
MAHTNRYYTVNADDPNISEIYSVIVGEPTTQRYSADGTQIAVKLHQGDHSDYSFLANYQEYSHEQILTIMETPDWLGTIPIK